MVEVVGTKYIEGVGKKSGKPYKAYIVHYVEPGEAQGFSGVVTGNVFINVDHLDGHNIFPGDKLELFYNQSGYLQKVVFC